MIPALGIGDHEEGTPSTTLLDPHHAGVWNYAADLAREAVDLGFSEVQLDYVRFPDEKGMHRDAVFPLANGRARAQVIREQIGATRTALESTGVPLTIDVFGLTTFHDLPDAHERSAVHVPGTP